MKLIEKIEIKYFRSFGEKNVKIIDLKDLNIFSGSNDVGKSNILKALNLFFNDEISIGEKFNLRSDLSFLQRERSQKKLEDKKNIRTEDDPYAAQRDLFVKIKIFFNRPILSEKSTTPEKFWVEKKWDKNGFNIQTSNIQGAYRKKNKRVPTQRQIGAIQGQLTQFLNSINFEYIPAVKDRQFLQYLFKKLQNSLFDRDSSFKKTSGEINARITKTTQDLFSEFKDKTGVQAEFSIPESLIDFFTTINVSTENGISLYSRGDGIQARFIPAILNEISKGKKNTIWGFEEPENSYEYRNAELLAKDFLEIYSKNKQVFITSHTKEFLSLIKGNEEKASLHRVYKTLAKGSLIETFKKNKGFDKQAIDLNFWGDETEKRQEDIDILNKIYEDIGFLESDQYLIEDLQNQLKMQRHLLNTSDLKIEEKTKINQKLTKRLESMILTEEALTQEIEEYKKPIVFFEDTYIQIYKIAFLKINGIECDENNFENIFKDHSPFIFKSKECDNELNKFLDMVSVSEWADKFILGVFDFDAAYNKFNGLKSKRWGDKIGSEKDGVSRKRKDHPCFYAMLLPVPTHRTSYASIALASKSRLAIELYFSDDILTKLGNSGEETVTGVSERIKIFQGDKSLFWKELFYLPVNEFESFKNLFIKITSVLDKPHLKKLKQVDLNPV
ncbi:MAG: ATP-binding protein [bacterium]|nr:ATP-binding protein [bacterium]